MTYCDTTNGVRNDVAGVAAVAARHGALTLADGVSSIGGMPFSLDAWGVDAAVTASQKCLMSSPGLSFVALSERGRTAMERGGFPRSYWDFRAIERAVAASPPETPGTTPVHLVLQVAESLQMMSEEGLAQVFARHEQMAARVRDGVAALGLSLQCPALGAFASTVTAIALPEAHSPRVVRDGLKARGILTAAGLGRFESHAFRIGHLGDIRLADVDHTLAALAEVLKQ